MTVLLEARDATLRRVGEVDDYTSLTMPMRFNATSTWLLNLDAETAAAQLLTETGGLIVSRDGQTLLSGPVTKMQETLQDGRRTLVVAGVDDTVWLEGRLALPVPAGPPYSSAAYDVQSGVAETVMRHYVDVNLGPSAIAARQLDGLTLAPDLARGGTVHGAARFHTLMELLQGLALAGGDLGFRIVQDGEALVFEVYEPQDRTGTAVFSRELGNLPAYSYETSRPSANYAFVAGGGEGTARVFEEGGDATSIASWQRIEVFKDRRDTTDGPTLQQARDEALTEGAPVTALALTPIDTESVAYGVDYRLGDRVTAVIGDEPVQDIVREVTLSVTPDRGAVLTPVVGTPGATAPDTFGFRRIFDGLRRQARQISSLERR